MSDTGDFTFSSSGPAHGQCPIPLALSSATLAAMVVSSLAFAAAHGRANGLSPVRSTVSEFGAVPETRAFISVAWCCGALAGALLCASFTLLLPSDGSTLSKPEMTGIVCLGIFAAARLLMPWFSSVVRPPDLVGGAQAERDPAFSFVAYSVAVPSHRWHVLFAFVSFAAVSIASATLGNSLQHHVAHSGLYHHEAAIRAVGLSVPLSLMLALCMRHTKYVGVAERVCYGLQMSWFYFVAYATVITCA